MNLRGVPGGSPRVSPDPSPHATKDAGAAGVGGGGGGGGRGGEASVGGARRGGGVGLQGRAGDGFGWRRFGAGGCLDATPPNIPGQTSGLENAFEKICIMVSKQK